MASYIVTGPRLKLVEAMADSAVIPDQHFNSGFLFTHRYFMSSRQLMDTLLEIFYRTPPASFSEDQAAEFTRNRPVVRARVFNVFHRWLEILFQDFAGENLLEDLLRFCENVSKDAATATFAQKILKVAYRRKSDVCVEVPPETVARIVQLINDPNSVDLMDRAEQYESYSVRTVLESRKLGLSKRESVAAKDSVRAQLSMSSLNPKDVAQQITMIEQSLYFSIGPNELLDGNWKKNNKTEVAPHIVELIEWFNTIDMWVATEIVTQTVLKTRRAVLSRFIQLAEEFLALKNFNGVKEVVTALERPAIQRLANTWKGLDKREVASFESMRELMSMEANHNRYREVLKRSEPPYIPYVGVHLQDLLSLEELPNQIRETGHVNFKKMRKIWIAAKPVLLRLQQPSSPWLYKFPGAARPHLMTYLTEDLVTMTEKEVYAAAKALEN